MHRMNCFLKISRSAAVKNLPKTSKSGASPTLGDVATSAFFCSLQGRCDSSVGAIFEKWQRIFEENSVPQARQSIENILAFNLRTRDLSEVETSKDKLLSEEGLRGVEKMCQKRLERQPLEYILGEGNFRDLNLKMHYPVFVPWPETEHLVDIVLDELDSRRNPPCAHVFEICTGTGAIAVSLLKSRPQIKLTAVDGCEIACNLAMENAKKYQTDDRFSVIHSRISKNNLLNFVTEKFDVIVSNPPYVPIPEWRELPAEINMYQDLRAVNGGEDGLDIIKMVLTISSRMLRKDGALIMEVNPTHPPLIKSFLSANGDLGLQLDKTHKDFADKDRYVRVLKI